jgi:hypothetical protein
MMNDELELSSASLRNWNVGMLEYWNIGILEYWNIGMMGWRPSGK